MKKLHLDKDGIERCAAEAAAVLKEGRLVIAPTDTLYGILADFSDRKVVEYLYQLKGRDLEKRLIALVPDLESAQALSREPLPPFAKRFWPGPLTIILPSAQAHPLGWETQAVRVPDSPWLKALLAKIGGPLFAPSANPQGRQPALTAQEAQDYFGDSVDLYIDNGSAASGAVPSTIVGWEDGGWRFIREGALTRAQLQDGLI